jgi:hypothetical protein
MLTEGDLRFLHMKQVRKIPETNNVVVHFHPHADGYDAPPPLPMIIGRKQFVLRLEKIAREVEPELWAVRSVAAQNAREARAYLWPKTL